MWKRQHDLTVVVMIGMSKNILLEVGKEFV